MSDQHLPVESLLQQLEQALRNQIEIRGLQSPALVGIHTGGAWIARQLHSRLQIQEALGLLNINFYRDDFSQIGMHPRVTPSSLPFRVEGRDIILVDDVLYSGRTIRAALNEVFDYGRPSQVLLAVLIDRDGRQIPIQADAVGTRLNLAPGQRIKLSGPEPLQLSIHQGRA
jgi:pyrimidine operon attenuation protein/uracil phosphoribosyltransferase